MQDAHFYLPDLQNKDGMEAPALVRDNRYDRAGL